MDTRFLESFLAVVELGSMAEAARRLGLTPAAVSQQVRSIEHEVGASLLIRAGRTVKPTVAGSAIAEAGRRIVREVTELRFLAAGGEIAGELRIGAISTAVTGILPPILKKLMEAAPALDLFVVPGVSVDLYRKLSDGEIDAAIIVRPQFTLPKSLDWRLLRSEKLVVLAPASDKGFDTHELLRVRPFIRYDRNNWGGRLADTYLRRVGVRPKERLELDSLEAIAIMVDQGLGISLVPSWAAPWPADINVCKMPLPTEAPERQIGLVWSRSSPRVNLIKAFVDIALRLSNKPSR
jgi:DNA-binding transcriptional LysR family regulator